MRESWSRYQVDVPPGKHGAAKVEVFEVNGSQARLYNVMNSKPALRRNMSAGKYRRLTLNGGLQMSDTRDEIDDHLAPIRRAEDSGGTALVAGLGLGVVLGAMLATKTITHVTVIEKSPDVIALVGPYYEAKADGRLTIVEADALEYRPSKTERYTMAWFDIWADICTDNLPEIATLHRRWSRRVDWYGSWKVETLRYLRRQERDSYW